MTCRDRTDPGIFLKGATPARGISHGAGPSALSAIEGRMSIRIGVIGAGAMGRGICQWAAELGATVLVFDARPEAAEEALAFVGDMLKRAAAKGKLSSAASEEMLARLHVVRSIADFAEADLVVEAILEDIFAKRKLFAELEAVVRDDAILCTNTSSLSITGCANQCRIPSRVIGLHFFNPAPLMKVVEVIRGERTRQDVVDRVLEVVGRSAHRPIVCGDTPGFVVNHAGRGLSTEGLRIVQEGVASFADVDRVMREYVGLPMGPFELFDLTGLDVSSRVLMEIYDGFFQEPRYRPSPFVYRRVQAGLFGRKVGEGFYPYVEGKKQEPAEAEAPRDARGALFVDGDDAVKGLLTQVGVALAGTASEAEAVVVLPLGDDATAAAISGGHDPTKLVALDGLFADRLVAGGRATIMGTPLTETRALDLVHAGLAAAGLRVTRIADSPGFIAQRVVANIVNTACEIAQQRIAAPADIEEGVKRGLGYPVGPFGLGDKAGGARILEVLRRLQALTGDPRYRPSLWLRRRAELGVSLATP
jgi:3-hydroxybutyryl-CoA dehydrogenase